MMPLSNRVFALLVILGLISVGASAYIYLNNDTDLKYYSPELYDFEPGNGDSVRFKICDEGEEYYLVMLIRDVKDGYYLSDLTYYNPDGTTLDFMPDVAVDRDFLIINSDDLYEDMDVKEDRMHTTTTLFGTLTTRHIELFSENATYTNIDGCEEEGDVYVSYDIYNYRLVKYEFSVTNNGHPHTYSSELISIKKA